MRKIKVVSDEFVLAVGLLLVTFFIFQAGILPSLIAEDDLTAAAKRAEIKSGDIAGILRGNTWEEFNEKTKNISEKFLGYNLEKPDGTRAKITVAKGMGENLDGKNVLYNNTKTGKLDLDKGGAKNFEKPVGLDAVPGFKKIKTLVLLTQFANSTPVDITAEEYQDRLFGTNGYVNKFYGEMTHERVQFDADVRGWYTFPEVGTAYTQQFYNFCFVSTDAIVNEIASTYQVDLSEYDMIISISNCEEYDSLGGQSAVWSPDPTGMDFIRILGHHDRLGVYSESSYTDWPGIVWNVNHEIGHVLGVVDVGHAKAYNCGDTTLGFNGNIFGVNDCHTIEYGNPFDVMGDWSGRIFGFLRQKELGLITDQNILDIHDSGEYFINNLQAPAGVIGAKIYIPGTNTPLFAVEHRKATGFDSGLSTGPGSASDGLIVYANKFDVWPIVDPHPTNLLFKDDVRNDSINATHPFHSTEYGISITVSEVSSEGVYFSVDYSGYENSPCGIFIVNNPTPLGEYDSTQNVYQVPNYPFSLYIQNLYHGISDEEAPCVPSFHYTLTAIDSDVPEFIGDSHAVLINTMSPSYGTSFDSQAIIPIGEHYVTVRATNIETGQYQDYFLHFSSI